MGKFKFPKETLDKVSEYSYNDQIRILAVLKIIEKRGFSEAVLVKWGRKINGNQFLQIRLEDKYTGRGINDELPEQTVTYATIKIPEL